MLHQPHSTYYRDRRSEEELCLDFPADKIFIDGLHAMQAHFDHNGVYIDIPVVRVMNTADQEAFKAQKDLPGGRKTLKAWYWSVELAAYDQAHQG